MSSTVAHQRLGSSRVQRTVLLVIFSWGVTAAFQPLPTRVKQKFSLATIPTWTNTWNRVKISSLPTESLLRATDNENNIENNIENNNENNNGMGATNKGDSNSQNADRNPDLPMDSPRTTNNPAWNVETAGTTMTTTTAKTTTAAVRTVNERLQAELQEAADKEKYGAKSAAGKKFGLDAFQSSKTEEERQAAIEEARNLNGVNPGVAIAGALFALIVALGLWTATTTLGEFFALHPVESDVYFVTRAAIVFRNVVIGLVSLAAGFFGVTGFGILLLGIRVAYGVATGELDPTPIPRKTLNNNDVTVPSVLDLMLNKKPSRRNRRRDDP